MIKNVLEAGKRNTSKLAANEPSADVMFMSGALKAAQNSPPEIRAKILSDVQAFTNIAASEVAFMFDQNSDNNDHSVFDMPDSERRRQIIRDNFLDAAE